MDLKIKANEKNSADYRPIHPIDSRPNVGGVNVIAVLVMFEFEDFHINMFSSERIRAIVINLSGIQLSMWIVYTLYSSHGEECICKQNPTTCDKIVPNTA